MPMTVPMTLCRSPTTHAEINDAWKRTVTPTYAFMAWCSNGAGEPLHVCMNAFRVYSNSEKQFDVSGEDKRKNLGEQKVTLTHESQKHNSSQFRRTRDIQNRK
jgi:hypothetical protein